MLTVLEANWEGDTGGELTVELRLGGTSTDSTPRDEVSDELRGNGVEKLRSDRDTKIGKIAQELSSKAETLVDLEGAVEVWVVDKTFPSDGGAWFLVKGQESSTNDDVITHFTVMRRTSQRWKQERKAQ